MKHALFFLYVLIYLCLGLWGICCLNLCLIIVFFLGEMEQVINPWKDMNGGRTKTHFRCGAQFPGPNNIWNLFVLVLLLLFAQRAGKTDQVLSLL